MEEKKIGKKELRSKSQGKTENRKKPLAFDTEVDTHTHESVAFLRICEQDKHSR